VAKFEPRNDDELSRLDDEALLEHIATARARGESEHAQRALAIIVFRYYDNIVRRVALRVPRDDVEDVAQEAVVSAIRSKLDGKSVGEFRNWLNRITGRRIADYTRKPRVDTTLLPEEHGDDESVWGTSGSVPAETGEIEINELVERAMEDLSDAHREVIESFVFEDQPAEDTVDHVNAKFPDLDPPMSRDNVSQIAKRFRTRLRKLLEESDNPG